METSRGAIIAWDVIAGTVGYTAGPTCLVQRAFRGELGPPAPDASSARPRQTAPIYEPASCSGRPAASLGPATNLLRAAGVEASQAPQ